MQETFFTSKDATQLTGCTLRQIQYWRERGILVPVISGTGTGRSIYYSRSNLVELAAMVYWLSTGISFDVACQVLKQLKEQAPELFISGQGKRFMLLLSQDDSLSLVEFDRKIAIASLDEGKAVIPVWLDIIYNKLNNRLIDQNESA
ncbi:MerR family transcriptional regulator [Anabaena sp. CS-542/02]|uniref:MerR family transcriptional regulator n=1 Tax=Anabaena sp. CS-542/02 TaxID=3021719 RepID=UPI00232AEF3B|nr:MerR family transcriptional regulator [Anabaena sp. CS-542/02]MDB9446037.1 MerR family transcriptional regulator [Anabaena sp. CS-542/02]